MPISCVPVSKAFRYLRVGLVLLLVACPGGGGGGGGSGNPPVAPLRLQPVGANLGLNVPLFATTPPGDTSRLFVIERGGVIKIIDMATQQVRSTAFLDLTGQIRTSLEEGMLGLAFHPHYSVNGFFYVNVTNLNGDTEIRRYTVSADPNVADPSSMLLIKSIDQPDGFSAHKAGWLGFGRDGFLYGTLGDGGKPADADGNGQNLDVLLGKVIRLDVDSPSPYIPPDNPFVGIPGADEIWASGMRNPFRVSFDRETGDFYIPDVGESRIEEVNIATFASGGGRGLNYGWNRMEGSLCFNPEMGCSTAGLTLPDFEYTHDSSHPECAGSIIGGFVYRGSAIPNLHGVYFYADFCAGFVHSFRFVAGAVTEQTEWPALSLPRQQITSFGEDAAGELYLMTLDGGLFRIVPN
jgi:glucose/arabinose dehydrogenase